MPLPSAITTAFTAEYPAVFARNVEATTRLGLRRGADAVTATAPTYVLQDGTGEVVHEDTPALEDGLWCVTVPASATDGRSFGKDLREIWTFTIDDEEVTFTREAALARYRLEPPCTQSELTATRRQLLTHLKLTSVQEYLDRAWGRILRRLWRVGTWPDTIVSTTELVDVHRELALVLIYEELVVAKDDTFDYRRKLALDAYEAAWGALSFTVDADQSGSADSGDRTSAVGQIHRNTAPSRERGRSGSWA